MFLTSRSGEHSTNRSTRSVKSHTCRAPLYCTVSHQFLIFSCLGSVALQVRVTGQESITIMCLSQLFYVNNTLYTCVDCQLRDLRKVAVSLQQSLDLSNCIPFYFYRKPA